MRRIQVILHTPSRRSKRAAMRPHSCMEHSDIFARLVHAHRVVLRREGIRISTRGIQRAMNGRKILLRTSATTRLCPSPTFTPSRAPDQLVSKAWRLTLASGWSSLSGQVAWPCIRWCSYCGRSEK